MSQITLQRVAVLFVVIVAVSYVVGADEDGLCAHCHGEE